MAPKPTVSVEPVGVVGGEDPLLKVVIQWLSGMDKSSSRSGRGEFLLKGSRIKAVRASQQWKRWGQWLSRRPTRKWRMQGVASVICAICASMWAFGKLQRHIYEWHLPRFYVPELACWLCEAAERSPMQLVSHQGVCGEGYSRGVVCRRGSRPWEESWNILFPCLAPNRKDSWKWLWGGDFTPWMGMSTFTQPRNYFICLRTPIKWREFSLFVLRHVLPPYWAGRLCLSYYPGWQSRKVWKSGIGRYRPPSGTFWSPPLSMHTVTLGWCSPEAMLSVCRQRHWSPEICSISWVVSNCVFREAWNNTPTLTAPEQMLVETRVAFTYGAHPKTEPQAIPWPLLECKIQESECVAVGKCELDGTSQNSLGRQKDIFTRQMKTAAKYGKPLVLHLRNGKTWSWTSSRLLSSRPRKCCPASRRFISTLSLAHSVCSPNGSTILWTFWPASVGYLCRVRRVRLSPGVYHSNVWPWNQMPLICPRWPEKWTAYGFSVITPRLSLRPGICLPLWCWREQP